MRVHIEALKNGNLELECSIADVSYYDRRVHILTRKPLILYFSLCEPMGSNASERLSNGICSLNPQVDRLTQSALWRLINMVVWSTTIANGYQRQSTSMTYSDVNDI